MFKDYKEWHKEKIRLNNTENSTYFYEREVWWCVLGENIGHEQDGGKDFDRPVIILKKFNLNACLVLPLTSRPKQGKYYFYLGKLLDQNATAIVSQLRFVDRKRLTNKICFIEKDVFYTLIEYIIQTVFSP